MFTTESFKEPVMRVRTHVHRRDFLTSLPGTEMVRKKHTHIFTWEKIVAQYIDSDPIHKYVTQNARTQKRVAINKIQL